MRQVSFNIDGTSIEYNIEGDTLYGSDKVLMDEDDNLIANTAWMEQGYTVQKFLSSADCALIRQGLQQQLLGIMQRFVFKDLSKFSMEKYHEYVNDELHTQVTSELRKGFGPEVFPGGIAAVKQRISEICGVELTEICPAVGRGAYNIRIVRPQIKTDNNPPHRDVWLDRLRNGVNIYFPLSGSNAYSALPIVPGSHLWKESEIERTVTGAKMNTAAYQVPAVTSWKKPMEFTRPNPQPDEVMVFTPYAIHGGGINLNSDITRMSLETRFWRKSP